MSANGLSQGVETVGTCFAATAGCPDTHDTDPATGFPGMDWSNTTIEVENYGEIGGTRNVNTWINTCTGEESKRPGGISRGNQTLAITHVIDDPVQVLLKTHFENGEPISWRITYANGDIDYLSGYVTSRPKQIGGESDHVMMSTQLSINGPPVEVPAP
jgi:hypothetical protein